MQAYRAEQEDQLGALGLVLNAVVLFNTRYIDLAVNVLRGQGYPVRDEDAAWLSPLGYAHINMLGRYAFPAPSAEQRPVRCATRIRRTADALPYVVGEVGQVNRPTLGLETI